MSARDELAGILKENRAPWVTNTEHREMEQTQATAILAAGYRKPRTITTFEELDALPDGVLVLTEQGGYWESIKRMDGLNWWKEPGASNVSRSLDLTLPATILYEPVEQ